MESKHEVRTKTLRKVYTIKNKQNIYYSSKCTLWSACLFFGISLKAVIKYRIRKTILNFDRWSVKKKKKNDTFFWRNGLKYSTWYNFN